MRACRRHPKERAGWNCASCRADLCPDCVTKQPGGPKGTQVPVCCFCGRTALPISVHRRAAQPFGRRLWRAFDFPLGSAGIIALLFLGFIRALTSYAGARSLGGAGAFILRQGLYWAFVFFIIRSVASGTRRMGVFGFTDIHSDLIAPAVKGIFSTAILWIPAVVYVYLAADNGLVGLLTYPSHRDPAVWLLAGLGALYAPMALLAAATDLGFGHILNPIFIGHAIYRMGKDYFVAVVAVAVVLLLGAGVSALLGAALAHAPVPFVGRWLTFTADLYAPFVAAGMLGILLYVHGEVLDWGRSEEYQELVLPGVEPRGQLRPRPEEKPEPPPARAAIPVPALNPGPAMAVEPLAPGPEPVAVPTSMLNLDISPPPESRPPLPAGDASPPSILQFGIVLSPSLLEAHALANHGELAPVDLPPADPIATTEPPPAPTTKPAPPASPARPVTAFVEPRPGPLNISAAPTVHGFLPALPPAGDAAPTRIGHEAVQPPAPEGKKS